MHARHALLLVLLLAPQKQSDRKHDPQNQVQPPGTSQAVPDSSRAVSETQFYTYNSQQSDRAEPIKVVSDILLAAFTLALVWVGYRQWETLREHEKWMERNVEIVTKIADAALLNAQAVINSERPWVFISAEPGKTLGTFIIRATVRGRTPALIGEVYSEWTFANQPLDLPTPPVYKSPITAPKEPLLGDGEEFQIADVNPRSIVDETWKAQPTTFNPYGFLCFYGIVRYEDCLSTREQKTHETGWCFAYFVDGDTSLHPIGPSEYCKKT